jgi:hypothetical protein
MTGSNLVVMWSKCHSADLFSNGETIYASTWTEYIWLLVLVARTRVGASTKELINYTENQ